MAAKADRFYYDNFIAAADCACKSADYLVECLTAYRPEKIETMLKTIHEYEHSGDEKKHEMSAALAKAFVTPIDREDLAELSQNIDEVTDCIEEVLQRFYIDEIDIVPTDAVVMAKRIAYCCHQMKQMLTELENFKKPDHLRQLIVDLNHTEEECDSLYLEATRRARTQAPNVLGVLAWRTIYDCMERCADACEHVADSVETIVMKNT